MAKGYSAKAVTGAYKAASKPRKTKRAASTTKTRTVRKQKRGGLANG